MTVSCVNKLHSDILSHLSVFKKKKEKSVQFAQYGAIVMKCFSLIVVHQCTFMCFV